jgi:methyl-accepting chemotaxis protein
VKWYYNLKISARLVLGFGLVIALASAACVVAAGALRKSNGTSNAIFEANGNAQGYLGIVEAGYQRMRAELALMNLEDSVEYAESVKKKFDTEVVPQIEEGLKKYNSVCVGDDDKLADYETLESVLYAFFAVSDEVITHALRDDFDASKAALISKESEKLIVDIDAFLGDLTETNALEAHGKNQSHSEDIMRTYTGLVISLSAILVVAVILVALTVHSIKAPLAKIVTMSDSIVEGHTDVKYDGTIYNDEIGVLAAGFVKMTDAINAMICDADMLTHTAAEGQLSVRADEERHKGDFRKIIKGVNDTLDAVIAPVQVAAGCLREMSQGNLSVMMEGEYKGDHAMIKNALNDTITGINAYITQINEALHAMAQGDLTVTIQTQFKGDFAGLKESINTIARSLSEVMQNINIASDQVASGTKQVSDGAQAVSQGATEQASSIEELTATMTQIGEQVKATATNANENNARSMEVKTYAVESNELMKELQKAMEEINTSSLSISRIIKVIDDIAFQTNILALNAAVEAARAGAHGKGFAVVAEEVRNLAAKSASAARETTELIENSVKKAESGTYIANETAKALKKIVTSIEGAAAVIGQIAVASNEQASGVAQVNKAIEQLSDVVQANSATSEQAAAAAQELSSQAEMLKHMVGRFQLQNETHLLLEGVKPALHHPAPESQPEHEEERDYQDFGRALPPPEPDPISIRLNDNDFGKY